MKAKPPKGYRILDYNEAMPALEKYHKNGGEPGVYVGYECLSPYYTMKLGSCTDWTGLPQSGKSQLMLQLLYYTSATYGWRHLLCVPDIGEYIEVLDILVHIHTGQSINPKYRNQISLQDLFKKCNWLFEYFKILEPEDNSTEMLSPEDFWRYAVTQDIHTAVIDSWKDMFHDYSKHGGNYARYLSHTLSLRNKLAQNHKKHFHTVIHPKNPRRNKEGVIQTPSTDDMEGGAQWNNSGKSILCVHRATFDTRIADIMVLKAKPRIVGERGLCYLEYDPVRGSYFERDDKMASYYAGELKYRKERPALTQANIEYSDPEKPPF